jgi:hypothetical protein
MFNIKLSGWVVEMSGKVFSELHRGARSVEKHGRIASTYQKKSRLVDIFLHLLLFGTTLMTF